MANRLKKLQYFQFQHLHRSTEVKSIYVLAKTPFTFAVCYRPSVCRLSVTFVHPT